MNPAAKPLLPPPTGIKTETGDKETGAAFVPAAPVVGLHPKKPRPNKSLIEPIDPNLKPEADTSKWIIAAVKDAATYPWRKDGWAIVIPGAILSVLLGVGAAAPGLGLFALTFSLGCFAALYFRVIATSIGGDNTLPDWPSFSNWSEDIGSNARLLLGASLLSYGPVIIYHFACPEKSRSESIELLLGIYGVCYHPMACISLIMDCGFMSAMPHKVIPAILRCLPGYLIGVLPLALISLLLPTSDSTGPLIQFLLHQLLTVSGALPLLGLVVAFAVLYLVLATLSLYLAIVQARITGLIGRRFRDKIGWG